MPAVSSILQKGTEVLFPASAVGRKGAYAMKILAQNMKLELTVLGKATEYSGFWEDVTIKSYTDLEQVALIVFPAVVEHQPRFLLRAIAMGIPVITTSAAGIPEMNGVFIVPQGDGQELENRVRSVLTQ